MTTQNVDNKTIAERLESASWSNDSHPTGLLKQAYGISTFQLTCITVLSRHTFKKL